MGSGAQVGLGPNWARAQEGLWAQVGTVAAAATAEEFPASGGSEGKWCGRAGLLDLNIVTFLDVMQRLLNSD